STRHKESAPGSRASETLRSLSQRGHGAYALGRRDEGTETDRDRNPDLEQADRALRQSIFPGEKPGCGREEFGILPLRRPRHSRNEKGANRMHGFRHCGLRLQCGRDCAQGSRQIACRYLSKLANNSSGATVAVPIFPTTMPAAWFEIIAASNGDAPPAIA